MTLIEQVECSLFRQSLPIRIARMMKVPKYAQPNVIAIMIPD